MLHTLLSKSVGEECKKRSYGGSNDQIANRESGVLLHCLLLKLFEGHFVIELAPSAAEARSLPYFIVFDVIIHYSLLRKTSK